MGCSIARTFLVAAATAVLLFGRAQAEPGDAATGQQIAQTWCSNCHLIGPREAKSARDAVPTFAAVARMPSTTSLSLHAFLQTPHGQMPDFALSRTEIDNIVAYILSLQARER